MWRPEEKPVIKRKKIIAKARGFILPKKRSEKEKMYDQENI